MEGERHALLLHRLHEQTHRAHHNHRIAGLDGDDHVGKLLGHADAQELHARLHHALGRVAIAAHDAVAQRPVVHTDAYGRVVLLADVEEGHEPGAYLLYLLRILLVGVCQLLEGACRVYIVTGVDAYLLGVEGSHVGHAGVEVHVGHERRFDTLATQSCIDLAQVFSFAHALCGEAHILAASFDDTSCLCHRSLGVGSGGRGHRLHTDGVVAPQRCASYLYFAALAAFIIEEIHLVYKIKFYG